MMSSTIFPDAAAASSSSNPPPMTTIPSNTSAECRMLLNVARYYDVISRLVEILETFSAPEAITMIHQPDLQQVLVCYGPDDDPGADDEGEIIEECSSAGQVEPETLTFEVPEEILAAATELEEDEDEMIVFEEPEEGLEFGDEADLQDLVEKEPIETDEDELGIEFEVEQFEEEEEEESAVSEYYVEYLQDEMKPGPVDDISGNKEEKTSQLQSKLSNCSKLVEDNDKSMDHRKTLSSRVRFTSKSEQRKRSGKTKQISRRCEFCEDSFDPKINVYNLHCLETHGRPLYNCFVCGKTFYLLTHLTEHIKSGHDATTANSFIMQSLWRTFQEDNATINECRMCYRLFSSPRAETQHQEFHLKELSLTCSICGGKHYQSQCNEPRQKFGNVYEKVQCPECQRWMSKKNIKEHIATHANERNYPCTVCKKTFKVQRTAHRHIQNHINAQNKKRKCYDCDEVLPDEDHLPKHYKTAHPEKHPYNCPICSAGFFLKPELTDHAHTHSGEDRRRISVKNPVEHYQVGNARVYECTLCRRGFSAKRTVIAHFIVHTDRPFACELCGASFRVKPALEDHVMDAHKVKVDEG